MKFMVTIDLRVDSPDALFNQAFEHAKSLGFTGDEAFNLLYPNNTVNVNADVEACLAMLLNPPSLAGCVIYSAEVDRIGGGMNEYTP